MLPHHNYAEYTVNDAGDKTIPSKKSESLPSPKIFSLSLNDGSDWSLIGDRHCLAFTDAFASIMKLEESPFNGSPKLVFCKEGDTGRVIGETIQTACGRLPSLNKKGDWHPYDHHSLRIWHHPRIPDVVCEIKNNYGLEISFINMCFSLHPIYRRCINKAALPLHAALVELDGRGFLLAAPGNKGKSTCCQRLPDYWRPLCDDETLVVLDKKNRYRAHPFPTWSEYFWNRSKNTWKVQYSVPLSGIFFLEQSGTDRAVPIKKGQATVLLKESATQVCEKFWRNIARDDQRRSRKQLFNNACKMAKQIPAYRLYVSLHGRFWEKIEQVIS